MSETAIIDNESGVLIPEETKTNIALLDKVSAGLKELQDRHGDVPDCTTEDGYKEAKALMKDVAVVRRETEKAHKGAKAFFWEGGKRIDAMKNSILEVTQPIEDGYKTAIKAVDDEKKRLEEERAAKEAARIDQIHQHMDRIKHMPNNALTLELSAGFIDELNTVELTEFEEFSVDAENLITQTLTALLEKQKLQKAQAEEAARLEEQRKEQEKQAAEIQRQKDELAEQQRKIDEAKRAEEQRQAVAEAERKAAEKAEQDRKEAEERAEKQRIADAERAEKEKAAAVEKAKQDAIEEERRKVEAEEKRKAGEAAEAARLAALKPDTEKLAAWINQLDELEAIFPEMETEVGQKAERDIKRCIAGITIVADKLIDNQEAA